MCRIRFPDAASGFETARQAWVDCGGGARSAVLVHAQVRQLRKQPEIAEAFFEPNSITHPWGNIANSTYLSARVHVKIKA